MSLYDFTDFDQAEYEQIVEREKREIAEEARAEGRAEGQAEGQRAVLAKLVRDGGLSPEQAADLLGIDVGELSRMLEES